MLCTFLFSTRFTDLVLPLRRPRFFSRFSFTVSVFSVLFVFAAAGALILSTGFLFSWSNRDAMLFFFRDSLELFSAGVSSFLLPVPGLLTFRKLAYQSREFLLSGFLLSFFFFFLLLFLRPSGACGV